MKIESIRERVKIRVSQRGHFQPFTQYIGAAFTVDSFWRLLKNAGFRIDRIIGFGPPLADLTGGHSKIFNVADRLLARLARIWPKLFAYQILIECTRTDSPADLMRQTFLPAPDQARLPRNTNSEPTLQTRPEHSIG